MSSDYIPRLRQELLRAGATQPSRFRRPRPARALRPLAGVAAVALVVVAVVLAFPLGGEQPSEPAADTVELSYRVDPSDAASAAQVMRERLATAGVRDARVSASGGTLTITAPASARADVAALTAPGRFAIYDWEASVLGPRGVPAPGDANVTGGQDAGRAAAISTAGGRAAGRAGRRAPRGGASDGWFALGGTPALTNADIERARGDVFDAMTERSDRRDRPDRRRAAGVHRAHAPDRRARRRERDPRERARVRPALRHRRRRPDRLRALHRLPAERRRASTAPRACRSRAA